MSYEDGDDNDIFEEDEDDDDDDDDDCMVDEDYHEMEIVEPGEDDEIDSDLEEQHKPLLQNIQDMVEDEDIENIVIDDGNPFEVDEDDIMLVDATDHMFASVLGQISSRRRDDIHTPGGSGGGANTSCATNNNDKSKRWRKKVYVRAGMEVLEAQHPPIIHQYSLEN